MLKVGEARAARCTEHPHRESVDRCDRCRRRYCADCLVRGRPELLCRSCWDALPELEVREARSAHWLYGRLDAVRANRPSVIAGVVIAVVLGLLAATGGAQVLSPAYRQQMAEGVTAVRRAPTGGGNSGGPPAAASRPPRVPTLTQPFFGSPSSAAEFAPGTDPGALVDGQIDSQSPAWRSPPGFVAVDVRVRVQNSVPTARVLFAHSNAAPHETWARDVELWVSLQSDWTNEFRIGSWRLAATTEPQEFPFGPAQVASARLRILSNYGDAHQSSLAEFAFLAAR